MISRAHITAWRSVVPWGEDAQIEQDLVLSRALVEIFRIPEVADRLVLRGGTALHKLLLRPSARYSEDIDLVQLSAAPIGKTLDAIRSGLDSWLGEPRRQQGKGLVTLAYRFESESLPVRPLRLKIEINTREHFAMLDCERPSFMVDNPWFRGEARVTVYHVDELFGTKLRALYQRKKGRDLFDLWLALDRGLLNAEAVMKCFLRYMQASDATVSRAEFEANLAAKIADQAFLRDVQPLLAAGVHYDATLALQAVLQKLVARLPGDPWRGEAIH